MTEPPSEPPAAVPPTASEGSSRRRRGSVAQLAGASYLVVALGLITGPIVARALGPVDRGHYAAIYVYANVMVTLLALGFPQAIAHRLVNRLERPERLIGVAFRFSAVLLVPATAIAIAVVGGLLDTPPGTAVYLGIFAIAAAPIGVFGSALQAVLTASGALGVLSWLRAAPLLVNFGGVALLALIGQLTLESYLVLTVFLSLMSGALAWHFVRIRPRGHAPLRPLLAFGLRGYPASFARLLNVQLDQLLLAPLVGPAQLGFYAIAVTVSRAPIALAEALSVRATGSVIDRERRLRVALAERYIRIALLVTATASGALAAVAPLLVPLLYGRAFEAVVAPVLLLLPGAVASSGARVATSCLVVIGRPGVTSIAEISALVMTTCGLLYALPRFGIAGAAAVSSIAYTYRFAIQLAVLRRAGVRAVVPRPSDAVEVLRALPLGRLRRN